MSETLVNPDFDRSNQGSLQGVIAQALRQFQKNHDTCLPATVISYDRTKNIASVQPQIQMVAYGGNLVNRGELATVPVFASGGGGFVVNFPLVAGSKGWIKANDRDISLYLQGGKATAPNTQRMHSFSDGVFYPDFGSNFTIAGEDSASAVIQNQDGSIRISLFPTKIKMTVGGNTFEINQTEMLATVGANTLQIGPSTIVMTSPLINMMGEVDIIGGPLKVNGVIVTVP